jgi:hypothetical protein
VLRSLILVTLFLAGVTLLLGSLMLLLFSSEDMGVSIWFGLAGFVLGVLFLFGAVALFRNSNHDGWP